MINIPSPLPKPDALVDAMNVGYSFEIGGVNGTVKYDSDGFWNVTVKIGKFTYNDQTYNDDCKLSEIAQIISDALVESFNNILKEQK